MFVETNDRFSNKWKENIAWWEQNISTIKTIFNYISKQMLFSMEANVLTDETRTVPHWKQTSVLLEACYIGSKI
jgi:hypothetical protein